MPKKIVKRHIKQEEIDDWKIQVLEDGRYPDENTFYGFCFYYEDKIRGDEKKALYKKIKKDFLKDWIDKHPCTRPWAWYAYDAPRWSDPWTGCFYHGTFAEPRRHISGGRKCTYNYAPNFYKGVFRYWHFEENDPPLFESEASYLKRLNLLTEAEEKYLAEHPELLRPQPITQIIPGIQSQKK